VQPEPPALDRELEAGAVFCRTALELRQERPVGLLDVDAPPCTGSMELAISISFRAANSGSAKGRSATNLMRL
jgi:hypothetical protein